MSEATIGTAVEDVAAPARERLARAEEIVKQHTLMSLAGGVLPLPVVDLGATLAIQLSMIGRLCALYDVPFSQQAARGAIMSLIANLGAVGICSGLFFSAVKLIPGIGTLAGVTAAPAGIAAVTWALGKLFIGHFETGGTLLDVSSTATREKFRDLVARGRGVVGQWSPGPSSAAPGQSAPQA